MSRLILASKSIHRAKLLRNAGIEFSVITANIDERAVEEPLTKSGMDGQDMAELLARAKAENVSKTNPHDLIIGCDQILTLAGKILHKPADMEEARRRLLKLSAKTHYLNSAVVLARQGKIIWSHAEIAAITIRDLDPGFIGRHLASAGEQVLSSVGAYQIEGVGVQLLEKIDGDYFSIIGLPLLPLLARLRTEKLPGNQEAG